MAVPDAEALREALRDIADPATGRDIVAAGLVEGIAVRGGLVQVSLLTDRRRAPQMEPLRQAVEARLAREPGVMNATAVLTAPAAPAPAARGGGGHGHGHGHGHGAPQDRPRLLRDVGAVVAVASGKGGVGKSTVAVNLAIALAQSGLRVGLLDADIYGPSLPRMLGLDGRPNVDGDRMIPLRAWGLEAMSIGFLVDPDTAMIWRGPMVMGALEQMMGQVAWGPLDVMVVDLPPGTGDAPLTMTQRVALAGAVIVSTPQALALDDVRRGVRMFERTGVPVLGVVENMSFFCCPNCGHRTEVFGHGGAEAEARKLDVDFLGAVPLLPAIREAGDQGTPLMSAAPESEAGRAFAALAQAVASKLRMPV